MERSYVPSYQSYQNPHLGGRNKASARTSNRVVDLGNGDEVTQSFAFPYIRLATAASVLAFVGTSATLLWVDSGKFSQSASSTATVITQDSFPDTDARGQKFTTTADEIDKTVVATDSYDDLEDLTFTLKRSGYDSLSFFTDVDSEIGQILTYKILDGRRA
jgi:hypothetical protein